MPTHDHTTSIEYRTIERHPGYRFGGDGSVWTLWRRQGLGEGGGLRMVIGDSWRQLTGNVSTYGYTKIYMKGYIRYVHSLVLEAFRGPRPDGMDCRHLDGNPRNNRIENLAWGTMKENYEDSVRHGTYSPPPIGERGPTAKLKRVDIPIIRARAARGETCVSIAKDYPVNASSIGLVVNRKSWKTVS